MNNLHINGCEGTMGYRATDSACQSESGVKGKSGKLLGSLRACLLHHGIELR